MEEREEKVCAEETVSSEGTPHAEEPEKISSEEGEEAIVDSGADAELQWMAAVADLENRYKRLQADFDNFRRRTATEKEQLSSYVKAEVIKTLLPVLDNFDRALRTPISEENRSFLEGFAMIRESLWSILQQNGLEKIESQGKPFDPNFHNAVMQVPSDEYLDDTVSEVFQEGYTVDGKTIRPAMVKVVKN